MPFFLPETISLYFNNFDFYISVGLTARFKQLPFHVKTQAGYKHILRALKEYFLVSLRSSEAAVAISALAVLRSPRRFAFAKLLVMTF